MDAAIQLKGFHDVLAAIYGPEGKLEELLHELGFEQAQIDRLNGAPLEALAADFAEALHRRLMGEAGQDTYYQVLSRRYGLDGEPPQPLEEIARSRDMEAEELARLWGIILEKCRGKGMQTDLKRQLKRLAVEQIARSGEKPSREHVAGKLERLSNLREAADAARLDYETKKQEILKKVQAELDALEVEYQPLMDTVNENIEDLETEIRTDVLLHGESVSGGAYRAIYSKGRVTWDGRGIEEYAGKHPELLKFRKQGTPIVTLRLSGDKDRD